MRSLVMALLFVSSACVVTQAPPSSPQPLPGRETPATCNLVSQPITVDAAEFAVTTSLDSSARFVQVEVQNKSEAPIQLLLQEWSVTAGNETSPIVTADTPNGQVASIVLSPVSLPSGSSYRNFLFMRTHHWWNSARRKFEVKKIVPLPTPSWALRNDVVWYPTQDECNGEFLVRLTYVINSVSEGNRDEQARHLGTVDMPVLLDYQLLDQ